MLTTATAVHLDDLDEHVVSPRCADEPERLEGVLRRLRPQP
jgi:hypothetical protein